MADQFDPVVEREKNSAAVMKATIEAGRAAELLDALVTGGNYSYHALTGLEIRGHTYRSETPRDAVALVMTVHTAKVVAQTVLDPEHASEDDIDTLQEIASKMFLLSGRESPTEPVAHTIEGFEWDEVKGSVESGTVAIMMLEHFKRAEDEHRKLGLLYGVRDV